MSEAPSTLRHTASGVLFMLVGTPSVLGAVVAMNELSEAPEKQRVEAATAIEVHRAPPPPPPPFVRRKPPPRKRLRTPPPPSLAALNDAAGGVDVGLPGLDLEDLSATSGDLLATDGDVVHTSDTVDDKPRPIQQTTPRFPSDLRRKGIEGYVLLSVHINAEGGVEAARVLESKPPGAFDEPALEAIRSWRFHPGGYRGERVATWVEQRIAFRLR